MSKPLADTSFQELVTEASGMVLESLLKGSLRDAVAGAVHLVLQWKSEKDEAAKGAGRSLTYTAEAQKVKGGKGMVSAWTDGVSLDATRNRLAVQSDGDELCAFRLIPGKTYRITVEELSDKE